MAFVLPVLLLLQAVRSPDRPVDDVRAATRAVEADSIRSAEARWTAALGRNSTDARALLSLATLARLKYDYANADRFYSRLASLSSAEASYRAWALLGMADSRLWRLPLDSAAAAYVAAAAAARAAHDTAAEASSMFGLTIARLRTTLPATALAIADSGMRLRAGAPADIVALGHCARAAVLGFQALRQASVEARAGIALARQAGDRRRAALCFDMLGQYYLASNEQSAAAAAFDTAVVLARSARDRSAGAIAEWWRAHHHLENYDHDVAQRDFSAALVEATASGNQFIEGWTWIRLAVVSWHFADMVSARKSLARGRALVREQGDGWGMAYGRYLEGAMALDAGQIDTAETAFREDLAWSTQLRQPLEQFTATFGLARAAASRGDWAAAQARFDDATRIAREHGMIGYLPQLEYEYGIVALRRGDLTTAESRFRAVLASRSGVSDLDRYAARSRIAEIQIARGEIDRAERELTDATNAIDSLRASLGDRDLRVLAFQARRGYDDVDLGFATIVGGLVAGGRVDAALDLAERRRARELRDRLVRGAADLPPDVSGVRPRQIVPDSQTAVLEYVTGSGTQPTTLFIATPRGSTAVRRPPVDSIAPDIVAFIGMVEAGAGAGALARQLGEAVFGSALDALPTSVSRLVIVADGALQRLPFDALRTGNGRYVIERFSVSISPSIAVVANLRSRPRPNTSAARVLALGDPRFATELSPTGSAADVYREAFSMNGGLPRLPGSAEEARHVARFADRSELRLRERASESFLKHAPLDSFDVIHLATHALVDERSVARTALAVASGDGDDGFIGTGELSSLKLDAGLVVLSACRTAQGVAVRGEGIQGLTAPLLAAGAHSVLATQWRIRDTEAVHFIDDFYRALARGSTVAEAARAAKTAAIDRGVSAATWAAFAVVGDPSVTIAVRAPSMITQRLVAAIGFGSVVILLYGVVMRMRRAADRSSVPSASRTETVQ